MVFEVLIIYFRSAQSKFPSFLTLSVPPSPSSGSFVTTSLVVNRFNRQGEKLLRARHKRKEKANTWFTAFLKTSNQKKKTQTLQIHGI